MDEGQGLWARAKARARARARANPMASFPFSILCMGQFVMGWDELGWAGLRWDELGWAGMGWDGLSCCRADWAGMGWAGLSWAGLCWAGLCCAGMGWMGWGGRKPHGGVFWAIGSPECVSSSRGCCSWCSSCIIVIPFSLQFACSFAFSVSNFMVGAEQSHLRTLNFSF